MECYRYIEWYVKAVLRWYLTGDIEGMPKVY